MHHKGECRDDDSLLGDEFDLILICADPSIATAAETILMCLGMEAFPPVFTSLSELPDAALGKFTLVLLSPPEVAIGQRLEKGETASDALENWMADVTELLTFARKDRRRIAFLDVQTLQMYPERCRQVLARRLPLGCGAVSPMATEISITGEWVLARFLLDNTPVARELYDELDASSVGGLSRIEVVPVDLDQVEFGERAVVRHARKSVDLLDDTIIQLQWELEKYVNLEAEYARRLHLLSGEIAAKTEENKALQAALDQLSEGQSKTESAHRQDRAELLHTIAQLREELEIKSEQEAETAQLYESTKNALQIELFQLQAVREQESQLLRDAIVQLQDGLEIGSSREGELIAQCRVMAQELEALSQESHQITQIQAIKAEADLLQALGNFASERQDLEARLEEAKQLIEGNAEESAALLGKLEQQVKLREEERGLLLETVSQLQDDLEAAVVAEKLCRAEVDRIKVIVKRKGRDQNLRECALAVALLQIGQQMDELQGKAAMSHPVETSAE